MNTPPTTSLFRNAGDGQLVAAGTTIFAQGDPGDAMYVVQRGAVDLVADGVKVATIGPDEMFGEIALIDQGPRSTAAIAQTETVVHRVDAARFMVMIRQTPFFAMEVMRVLAYRLRQMDARLTK
ncbi:MAG: Crp/Fnr family transcriptional regulator [Dehalococcoidia bacterium]